MDFSMHRGSDEVLFRYSIQNDNGSENCEINLHTPRKKGVQRVQPLTR